MAEALTPQAISGIDEPERIRVTLYANNQPVHAPLVAVVEAGAVGRLLPPGGDDGDVLTKASDNDYDVTWSKSIGPRAWVNFDGEVPATIRDQFNVTSVVRNSIGNYTVNYAISMGAAHAPQVTAGDTGTPGLYSANLVDLNTSYVNFQIRNHLNALVDVDTVSVLVFGREYNFLILEGDMQSGLDKILLEGDMAPGVLLAEPSTV